MGGKASAPDTTALAYSGIYAANLSAKQADKQMAFYKQVYDEQKPLMDKVANTQIAAQDQQMAHAKAYYDHWNTNFRGLEKDMAADATRFNTDAYKDQLAGTAAAQLSRQAALQQAADSRRLSSMGINPSSGRMSASNRIAGLQTAAAKANAYNSARMQADQTGWARRLDAAGLGRNMPGASTGAYGGASAAGSSSLAGLSMASNNYASGMQSADNLRMSGVNTMVQGLGSAANVQAQVYSADQAKWGAIYGGAAGAATAGAIAVSDRRLKTNIRPVGTDGPTGLTLYEFSYRNDAAARRYVGVMADEVMEVMPQAVVEGEDGFMRVMYDMLGISMVEVG